MVFKLMSFNLFGFVYIIQASNDILLKILYYQEFWSVCFSLFREKYSSSYNYCHGTNFIRSQSAIFFIKFLVCSQCQNREMQSYEQLEIFYICCATYLARKRTFFFYTLDCTNALFVSSNIQSFHCFEKIITYSLLSYLLQLSKFLPRYDIYHKDGTI